MTSRISKNTYEYDDDEIQTPDQPLKPQTPDPKAEQRKNQKDDSCGCGQEHEKGKKKTKEGI